MSGGLPSRDRSHRAFDRCIPRRADYAPLGRDFGCHGDLCRRRYFASEPAIRLERPGNCPADCAYSRLGECVGLIRMDKPSTEELRWHRWRTGIGPPIIAPAIEGGSAVCRMRGQKLESHTMPSLSM